MIAVFAATIKCPRCQEDMLCTWADREPAPQTCAECGHLFSVVWPGFTFAPEVVNQL
jgi:Zn ribbon nucleic-acid-binding protein